MLEREYKTKEEVLRRAKEAIGIPFYAIDKSGRLSSLPGKGRNKGSIGLVLEEDWFHYKANSKSEPDFEEAGVELKVTPYIVDKANNIRAKERLVANIINYMQEYKAQSFTESSFWKKCETILIMSYRYLPIVPISHFMIDQAILFSIPYPDLLIIKQDWQKIVTKIRQGKAHELSEADTLYLAACTKGVSAAKSMRAQPFSNTLAKQRAYSLKVSYMTSILNRCIFKKPQRESVVGDLKELKYLSFENYIRAKLAPFLGLEKESLLIKFDLTDNKNKNINEMLVARILGIKGKIGETDEFKKANIIPKTIRIEANNTIKESMSFPAFKFKDLIQQKWESSDLKNTFEETKFLFLIFQKNKKGKEVFKDILFWNMPINDLEVVKEVWKKTQEIIQEGVQFVLEGNVVTNNLPKGKENPIVHVRPHASQAAYRLNNGYSKGVLLNADELPDGQWMTKQCFWLKNTYILQVIIDAKIL